MERGAIETMMRDAYAARVKGDLDAVMQIFHPDAVFLINGAGTRVQALTGASTGRDAIRPVMGGLIQTWKFEDWRVLSLVVEGEKAVLNWSAKATCIANGQSAPVEVADVMTFRDGKVIEFKQFADTALILAMATAA